MYVPYHTHIRTVINVIGIDYIHTYYMLRDSDVGDIIDSVPI